MLYTRYITFCVAFHPIFQLRSRIPVKTKRAMLHLHPLLLIAILLHGITVSVAGTPSTVWTSNVIGRLRESSSSATDTTPTNTPLRRRRALLAFAVTRLHHARLAAFVHRPRPSRRAIGRFSGGAGDAGLGVGSGGGYGRVGMGGCMMGIVGGMMIGIVCVDVCVDMQCSRC